MAKLRNVPGLQLAKEDTPEGSIIFTFEQKRGYDPDSSAQADEDLDEALAKAGIVKLEQTGPVVVLSDGYPLKYEHSRTVTPGPSLGSYHEGKNDRFYSSGVVCYPAPDFAQCNLPSFINVPTNDWKITGITQDETRAKVNILIPWRLSPLALSLKPFAAQLLTKGEAGNANYWKYPFSYQWAHLINEHQAFGESPAAVLFQKFDDGWRIVDSAGKSAQDATQD